MKTKNKEKSPKDRGLNTDEQKRRTNRPEQQFPGGTNKKNEADRNKTKKEKSN